LKSRTDKVHTKHEERGESFFVVLLFCAAARVFAMLLLSQNTQKQRNEPSKKRDKTKVRFAVAWCFFCVNAKQQVRV